MQLLFDVGGTNIRLALTEDGQAFTDHIRVPTNPGKGGFDEFIAAARQLAGHHKLTAVAGGLPGHANHTGILGQSPNLPGWTGVPVVERLQEALGAPVVVENDTAVVGLGEAVYGAGRQHDIVVYITVSTGINGVRVVRGAIDPSVAGFEVGEMLLPDEHGQLVSLESLAGGAALERRYGRPARELRGQKAVWQQEARHLARGLYNTALHWSPELVVYGGAMMRDIPLAAIEQELAALPPVYSAWPPLATAQLGDEGGLYGALALLHAHLSANQ